MLALLKRKNPYEPAAQSVYGTLLAQSRKPAFYTQFGVPDTFDGRFDLLLVHVFLVINRMKAEGAAGRDFNQGLFDAVFADMDQTLRERGLGDMGVPKHMRRMMKAFNGRMHIYADALEDDGNLALALARNLYGTREDAQADAARMTDYIKQKAEALTHVRTAEILSGNLPGDIFGQENEKQE